MDERNKLFDTGLKQLLLSVGGRQPIFSEVQQNDEGSYHCIVTLKAFPGDTLATDQPPTETSLDIKLDVLGDSKYFVDFSSQCSRFLRTGAITSDDTLILNQN